MITRKEFEDENFTVLRGKANKILEFLKENKDKAYLSKEIAEAVKIPALSSTTVLKKLIDAGLVDKKAPYYSFSKSDKKVLQEESKKKVEVESEIE